MIKLKDLITEKRGTCWKGYSQIGMKKKGNRMVPNCVKNEEKIEEGKADKSFDKIMNLLRKESRRLNDDDAYELSTKLKAWFNKNIL